MLKRLCLAALVSTVTAIAVESKPVVSLPKGWRLLVVKRAHCRHCVQWVKQVYIPWNKLGMNKLIQHDAIEILDAEVDAEVEKLVSYLNTRKIREDVASVPAFIILDPSGQEKRQCRFDGYSSYRSFRDQLSQVIASCTKENKA